MAYRANAIRIGFGGLCFAICFPNLVQAAQGPGVGIGAATIWEQAAAPLVALAFLLAIVALARRDGRRAISAR